MVWGQSSIYSATGIHQANGYGPTIAGTGFVFRKRTDRLDWRKLASVDIERIAREVDVTVLQDNICNITFCNIEHELDLRDIDPNFIKVFKLAQLTIEYLLHSQDYLHNCIESLQEKLHKISEDHEVTTKMVEKKGEEIKLLRKENKRKKKLLSEQQQQMLLQPTTDAYHKCPFCEKAFIAPGFVQNHIMRRHSNVMGTGNNSYSKTLEAELKMMKERLENAEAALEKERSNFVSLVQKEEAERLKLGEMSKHEIEEWKEKQNEGYLKEVAQVKEMLLKEMKEMHEKYSVSQQALHELQTRSVGQQSHLGNLQDTEEEAQRKHHEELASLKAQLQAEVGHIQVDMEQQLLAQEKKYRVAIKQIKTQHTDEKERLKEMLEDQHRILSSEEGNRTTLYNEQLQQMLKQTRMQDHLIQQQQKEIQELKNRPIPVQHQQPVESSEESESDEDAESQGISDPLHTNEYGMIRSNRMIRALKIQPALLTGIRGELLNILNASLEDKGIKHGTTGINERVYSQKLLALKAEKQHLAKKHENFYAVREQFSKQANVAAKRKLKIRKAHMPVTSIQPGNEHKKPVSRPGSRGTIGSPGEKAPVTFSKPVRAKLTIQRNITSVRPNTSESVNISSKLSDSPSLVSQDESECENQTEVAKKHSTGSESEWDDYSSGTEDVPSKHTKESSAPINRSPASISRVGSGVVAELTRSIERQLQGKSPGGKPKVPPRSPKKIPDTQQDEESDFSLSSLEELQKYPQPKPRTAKVQTVAPVVKPRRSSSVEAESTYGTSVWGSSKGSAVTLNAQGSNGKLPASKASISWDSDGDLDVEDLGLA